MHNRFDIRQSTPKATLLVTIAVSIAIGEPCCGSDSEENTNSQPDATIDANRHDGTIAIDSGSFEDEALGNTDETP